jgi:hypothetical protein
METMNGEEATQYILPVQLLLLTSVFRCASGSFLCRDLDLFYGEHFGWKQ